MSVRPTTIRLRFEGEIRDVLAPPLRLAPTMDPLEIVRQATAQMGIDCEPFYGEDGCLHLAYW